MKLKRQQKRIGLVALLSLLLAGCATPPAPIAIIADETAKEFVAKKNTATIYVFDHHAPISQFNFPVVIDTQIAGHLGKGRYMMLELTPGTYVFTSIGGQQNPEFEITVEAGKLYFIKQSQLWSTPWAGGRFPGASYEQVDETNGKNQIEERQRVAARFRF